MEQANFSELKDKIDTWDTQAEEALIEKVKLFTIKYNEDFQSICKNFDNFSNLITSAEVEHLNAINQLKDLSNMRFVEQSLEKKEDNQPESTNETPENTVLSDADKKNKSLELSLQFMEIYAKKHKKEAIEDDAVSVQSSKMTMDKNTKGIKLPLIINTEEFKADKAIGLNVAPENNEEEEEKEKESDEEDDQDIEEFVSDIAVDAKQRAKWKKIKEKKLKEKKKKKEKERLKQQKSKKGQKEDEKVEEPEVKVEVPIENEDELPKQPKQEKESNEIKVESKSGGPVPQTPTAETSSSKFFNSARTIWRKSRKFR